MKTLTIRVTAKDIKEGRKNMQNMLSLSKPYCNVCPFALALKQKTGLVWRVSAWRATCGERIIQFSKRITDWLIDFDTERPVKPISFKIKVP